MICSRCEHQEKWFSIWPKLPVECKECNKGEEKELFHPYPINIKGYKNNFKPKENRKGE